MNSTEQKIKVYEGKWGYYPCDKETFLKLKKLNHAFFKAQKKAAEWHRWNRKSSQNRIIKEIIKNGQGQKIGYNIIGPKSEPKINPIFSEITDKTSSRWFGQRTAHSSWLYTEGISKKEIPNTYWEYNYNNAIKYRYDTEWGKSKTSVEVNSFGVDLSYRQAKHPKINKEDVKPLMISKEKIDKLYEKIIE